MISSILVRIPVITRDFDEEIGVEIINKYFVRLKGDIYIPLFNLPLLHPEIFPKEYGYKIAYKLTNITFKYYKEYIELRKRKQFKVKIFLPEKYGGNALYYLLQKFMIGEATSNEVEIVSEFLSREIFNGKNIDMWNLLYQYYLSIRNYDTYKDSILVNTPVSTTPLYVSETLLEPYGLILTTYLCDYRHVAFLNVLTSYFFDKSIQIGSTRFNLLKSIGELNFNWNNVKVISFKELYEIHNAIIENNLEMTNTLTLVPEALVDDYYMKDVFLLHSPILSAVGNAIDFKNKSVMFLFVMLKRIYDNTTLTKFNDTVYLNRKEDVEFFVVSVPFKNIKKFIFRTAADSGIFIIEQGGKVIPVLSTDVGLHWIGVGGENIVLRYEDYGQWYGLLRELASPEHLKTAEKKTLEWLKS